MQRPPTRFNWLIDRLVFVVLISIANCRLFFFSVNFITFYSRLPVLNSNYNSDLPAAWNWIFLVFIYGQALIQFIHSASRVTYTESHVVVFSSPYPPRPPPSNAVPVPSPMVHNWQWGYKRGNRVWNDKVLFLIRNTAGGYLRTVLAPGCRFM